MTIDLTGKTALVVGASRGIGLAIANGLAHAGAHTVLAARSLEALEKEAERLRAVGLKASTLQLDVTNPNLPELPPCDILVNVSGTNIRKQFERYTPDEYNRIMDANLHGLVRITQKAGAAMAARGQGGKIVFVGSLMSLLGLPYLTVYAMTKAALAGLTRTLAAEWGRHGIQVNCIAPGFILTDLNRSMWESDEEMLSWLRGAQAIPRLGTPDDIAPLGVFLCGPGSDYITGQVLAVDGGYTTTANWPFQPQS